MGSPSSKTKLLGVENDNHFVPLQVTQYLCTDEIYSGSEGCLQYYTATTGTIQSYAMPSSGTIDASQTHLVNQDYSICFKRTNAMTCLCLVPDVTASTSVSNQVFLKKWTCHPLHIVLI